MKGERYRLRTDRYLPGGRIESQTERASFTSLVAARAACDEMQRQLDYECNPVTVWVVDQDDVPRYRVRGFNPPSEYELPADELRRLRAGRIA